MFIAGTALEQNLKNLCRSSRERLLFISPYVKFESFEHFVSRVDSASNLDKKLITNWGLSDLIQGVSDLAVYPIARDAGWTIHIVENLHAKLYLADNKALLGSANLTSSGFSLRRRGGNIEAGCLIDVDEYLERWTEDLVYGSVAVTDRIYSDVKREVEESMHSRNTPVQFSYELSQRLRSSRSNRLLKDDLFLCEKPMQICGSLEDNVPQRFIDHDRITLGVTGSPAWNQIEKAFLQSKAWNWLCGAAGEAASFGYLSAMLHEEVGSTSRIRRKTIKQLLNNLLTWAVQIIPETVQLEQGSNRTIFVKIEGTNI